jgi:hypothetical protein
MLMGMCAVLTVGTAAASAHQHTEIIGSNCGLCCVGHFPELQSPHLSDIRPSVILDWQFRRKKISPVSIRNSPRLSAARHPPV